MKIAIIGGGITGLVLAYKLSQKNHQITIFEKEKQLGGLATYYNYGSFFWDKFYHVILPSDSNLISFLDEIGLGSKLKWQETKTGYYVDKTFYSISNSKEFLSFPPLGFISKLRLGLTILVGASIKHWQSLEQITANDWLIKWSGNKTFKKFWLPLLTAKFGENYNRVSAVFIWTYIKRLFSAREKSSVKKEQLGYISGGYKTIIEQIENVLMARDVIIMKETSISNINQMGVDAINVHFDAGYESFNKVVFTGPTNVLKKVVSDNLVEIQNSHNVVEYMGVVSLVLITSIPLVPFYTVNIADPELPFTGIIGMSTVVDIKETAGLYITYFPKYVLWSDPIFKEKDEMISTRFLEKIYKLFPELKEDHIHSVHINKASTVQPLQVINYSKIIPKVKSKHKDFYILNSSQLIQDTLNNNAIIKSVNSFIDNYGTDFQDRQQ